MTDADDAEAQAALRAERENEYRIYLAVRSDVDFGRGGLARLAAAATWEILRRAAENAPDRFRAYDAAQQPKIGVRLKNDGQALKAVAEAEAAGLPNFSLGFEGLDRAIVAVGPVARAELPKAIRSLQMLGDEAAEGVPHVSTAALEPDDDHTPTLWIAVRGTGIPYGKLAAQAGHGAWGALGPLHSDDPAALAPWIDAGERIGALDLTDLAAMDEAYDACRRAGLNTAYIVDAGRTVFGGVPTPTVLGIGPCPRSALPECLRHPAASGPSPG